MELEVKTPCPSCNKRQLTAKKVLKASKASLAGMQMKFNASEGWYLQCHNCNWEGEGELK